MHELQQNHGVFMPEDISHHFHKSKKSILSLYKLLVVAKCNNNNNYNKQNKNLRKVIC